MVDQAENIPLLRYFLETSGSKYVQFVAASALKSLFVKHWSRIPLSEKKGIKDYMLNFLMVKGPTCDNQVLKMAILNLVKVVKMSWFDHPEL